MKRAKEAAKVFLSIILINFVEYWLSMERSSIQLI